MLSYRIRSHKITSYCVGYSNTYRTKVVHSKFFDLNKTIPVAGVFSAPALLFSMSPSEERILACSGPSILMQVASDMKSGGST